MKHTRRWPEKSSFKLVHQPVMLGQVTESLADCPAGIFVDATVGFGGHTKEIFRVCGDKFKYYGFDLDGLALKRAYDNLLKVGLKAELVKRSYAEIAGYLQGRGVSRISAALYDLGIGSFQIDDPLRGFSYLGDGPLSMSFDDEKRLAAAELIQKSSFNELVNIFQALGQEKAARAIARAVKSNAEKITTTGQLAELIRSVVGRRRFVKTAARIFQALRIAVNDELNNLRLSLDSVVPMLAPGGRLAVITYHSLDDGLVKRIYKKYSGRCICPPGMPECRCGKRLLVKAVFPKPVLPEAGEIGANPRARSAKLRVVERVDGSEA